jgi:hypothetical protein
MSTLKVDNILPQNNGTGTGRILEMFGGICAGQAFDVLSGSYTLGNVIGVQNLSTSYEDVTGSSITYTPPAGTKNVIYEYTFLQSRGDDNSMLHGKVYLDSDEILHRRFTVGDVGIYGTMTTVVASFQCNASSEDLNTGALTSWTSAKTIKIQAREYNSTIEAKLHQTFYWDGTSGNHLHRPSLKITAIG